MKKPQADKGKQPKDMGEHWNCGVCNCSHHTRTDAKKCCWNKPKSNTPDDVKESEQIWIECNKDMNNRFISSKRKDYWYIKWIPLATHEKIVKDLKSTWIPNKEVEYILKDKEQQITDLKGDLSTTYYWQQATAKKNQKLLELKKSIAKAMEELSNLPKHSLSKHPELKYVLLSDVEHILKKVMEHNETKAA